MCLGVPDVSLPHCKPAPKSTPRNEHHLLLLLLQPHQLLLVSQEGSLLLLPLSIESLQGTRGETVGVPAARTPWQLKCSSVIDLVILAVEHERA